jgi:hypothetical protein
MSENTKITRRAAIIGATAAAALATQLAEAPTVEGLEAGALKLPLTTPLQSYNDVPISGGHQTSLTLFTNGANGINYRHNMVITRIGNNVTIQNTITKINVALQKIIGTENYTHTYTTTPVAGGTQVNGNTVINGNTRPALKLNFKGTNPYSGTDPQSLVNQVFSNKRLS